jgi:hypothetical protein
MNKSKIFLITLISVASIGLTSCKKEGCTDSSATNYNSEATKDDGSCKYEDPTPTTPQPTGYNPTYTGEFGLLVGIKTVSTTSMPFVGDVDVELNTAVAVFSNNGGSTFLNAGGVTANGETLTKQTNNQYVYTPAVTNLEGINFGSQIEWIGTGGDWPSFNIINATPFPTLGKVPNDNVNTSNDFTLTTESVTGSDSLYYAVYGPQGSIFTLKPGNVTSHTFTSTEMGTIGKGQGYVQVTAIKYNPQVVGGKNYWILNETVRTNMVTFE